MPVQFVKIMKRSFTLIPRLPPAEPYFAQNVQNLDQARSETINMYQCSLASTFTNNNMPIIINQIDQSNLTPPPIASRRSDPGARAVSVSNVPIILHQIVEYQRSFIKRTNTFFFFLFFKSSGGWVKIKLLSSHASTYEILVVCQFNPTLPLQQQLALLLPGA